MSERRKWINTLSDEDINFIKNFTLFSGSLKELANLYSVTYPTIRVRLNKLIEKIKLAEVEDDHYIHLIKNQAIEGKIDYETAKLLIDEYRRIE